MNLQIALRFYSKVKLFVSAGSEFFRLIDLHVSNVTTASK